MEKSKSSNSSRSEKAVHQVEYVNLQEFGYEKSGHVKGDPEIYTSYLNRILNGDLVDEKFSGMNEDEKPEKREKLKRLESRLEEVKGKNGEINTQVGEKQDKIDKRREELLDIRKKYEKDPEAMKRETFSPFKFSINLFILLMLTAYLFFFYVSAAYKAL
jgi:chromosome segregation ATPase